MMAIKPSAAVKSCKTYRATRFLLDQNNERVNSFLSAKAPMSDEQQRNDMDISDTKTASGSRATRRSLPIALLRAREAVMSHFRPMLAKHDVTEQQWRVIRVLDEMGMLDASEVAERAFILPPSLTRMIRSLEERGFISKHKDKGDGRRVLLKIAPAGEAIILEVLPDSTKIYEELEAHFSRERLDALLALLDDLAAFRNDSDSICND